MDPVLVNGQMQNVMLTRIDIFGGFACLTRSAWKLENRWEPNPVKRIA